MPLPQHTFGASGREQPLLTGVRERLQNRRAVSQQSPLLRGVQELGSTSHDVLIVDPLLMGVGELPFSNSGDIPFSIVEQGQRYRQHRLRQQRGPHPAAKGLTRPRKGQFPCPWANLCTLPRVRRRVGCGCGLARAVNHSPARARRGGYAAVRSVADCQRSRACGEV